MSLQVFDAPSYGSCSSSAAAEYKSACSLQSLAVWKGAEPRLQNAWCVGALQNLNMSQVHVQVCRHSCLTLTAASTTDAWSACRAWQGEIAPSPSCSCRAAPGHCISLRRRLSACLLELHAFILPVTALRGRAAEAGDTPYALACTSLQALLSLSSSFSSFKL